VLSVPIEDWTPPLTLKTWTREYVVVRSWAPSTGVQIVVV
jgi:hypothetical protein